MRRRRDSFGRQTFIPERAPGAACDYCGQKDPLSTILTERDAVHRCYRVMCESDGGRSAYVRAIGRGGSAAFCSWSCVEAYTGLEFAR